MIQSLVCSPTPMATRCCGGCTKKGLLVLTHPHKTRHVHGRHVNERGSGNMCFVHGRRIGGVLLLVLQKESLEREVLCLLFSELLGLGPRGNQAFGSGIWQGNSPAFAGDIGTETNRGGVMPDGSKAFYCDTRKRPGTRSPKKRGRKFERKWARK